MSDFSFGRNYQTDYILGLKTQFDVFRLLKQMAEAFGFKYFIILRMPGSESFDLNENSIITNWPSDFLKSFDDAKLLRSSPLIALMQDCVLPLNFRYQDLVDARDGEDADKAREMYAPYLLWNGVCIPLHDPCGERAAIIFSGDRQPLDHQEFSELTYLAIHIYQRLVDVTRRDRKPNQKLTQGEYECLKWTASGKTSGEIGQILKLSQHTVNHYLGRVIVKLDAVNRTQAVAKAVRQKII